MKKVIVTGWLYVADKGTPREKYFHSMTPNFPTSTWTERVMPCNFEVMVPDTDDVTPVVVLAADAEFAQHRAASAQTRVAA